MFHQNQQIGIYILKDRIGRGGFGEVWLAERQTELLTTLVAVKLPHSEQIDLPAIKQEAALWAKASGHPNVLPIIEANIYNGQVIIASEFAPDGSLDKKLERDNKLLQKQAVEMTIGILNGLEFLHSRQIIHRDVKPANILLQGETPRLADFGISRIVKTTALNTTAVGTPSYMSPEAFDGKRNVQTDIWSVGIILHQLLSGKLPFSDGTITETMWAVVTKEPEKLPPTTPQDLQRIVSKALTKDPANRYQTAHDMKEELQRFLAKISYSPLEESVTIPLLNQEVRRFALDKTEPEITQGYIDRTKEIERETQIPLAKTQASIPVSEKFEVSKTDKALSISNVTRDSKKNQRSMMLYVIPSILIGVVLAAGGYFYGKQSQSSQPIAVETPKIPEMQTPGIAYAAFENNRRNVDKNPAQYISANFLNAQDSEDFYLLGRAYLLQGNYDAAGRNFARAEQILSQSDTSDEQMLTNEINIGLSIINSQFSRRYLDAARESASAQKTVGGNTNTNMQSNTEIKPLN